MKNPIRKSELKGVGSSPNYINFEELKKQLNSNTENKKSKSPFSNFFDNLKTQKNSNSEQ